jgi:rhamnosyltransferase
MQPSPDVSVVVRAKDEAAAIGRTLDLLAAQTLADRMQVVVVDSGSTDGTLEIVRARDVDLIQIPAATFTFGHALNVGTEAAHAPIVVALSAHAFPKSDGWLADMAAAFADERVAAACGDPFDFDGKPLTRPRVQDIELARRNPFWGYSNAAGAYRRELWERHRFREDLPGSEDKEFAWHWQHEGYAVLIDPLLCVDHDHSHDPLPDVYRRARREALGYGMYMDLEPYPVSALAREWWSQTGSWRNHLRARLSPLRAMQLAGRYAGLREARRLQGRA